MIVTWVLVGAFSAILLSALFFLLVRSSRAELHSGFMLLLDNFDNLQKNLLLGQKEFERSHDLKSNALRAELAQELQTNRRELQQGLSLTTAALEQKVVAIDMRLVKRLAEMAT